MLLSERNGKCHDSITGSLLTICRNALSLTERIAYTDAVLCLKSKDPLTPPSVSPGTLSRFDDFQATHVNQSSWVHWSVSTSFRNLMHPTDFHRFTSCHGTATSCIHMRRLSVTSAATLAPILTGIGLSTAEISLRKPCSLALSVLSVVTALLSLMGPSHSLSLHHPRDLHKYPLVLEVVVSPTAHLSTSLATLDLLDHHFQIPLSSTIPSVSRETSDPPT